MSKKVTLESFTLNMPKLANSFDLTSRFETLTMAAIADIQAINERRNEMCKELTISAVPNSPPPVVRKKTTTTAVEDAAPKPPKKQVTIKHRVFAKYAKDAGPLCRAIAPVGASKIRPVLYSLQHTILSAFLECGPKLDPSQLEHSNKYSRRVVAMVHEISETFAEYPGMSLMNSCAGDIAANIRSHYEKLPEYAEINFRLFSHAVASFMSVAAFNAASSFLHQTKVVKAYNVTIDDFINASHYFNANSDHTIHFEVILIKYTAEFTKLITQDKEAKKIERERKQAEIAKKTETATEAAVVEPIEEAPEDDEDYTAETEDEEEVEYIPPPPPAPAPAPRAKPVRKTLVTDKSA